MLIRPEGEPGLVNSYFRLGQGTPMVSLGVESIAVSGLRSKAEGWTSVGYA